MQNEAENLFSNIGSGTQMKIPLELTKIHTPKSLLFTWTAVGGSWYVRYFLEYATGAEFKNPRIHDTTEPNLSILNSSLDKNSQVHYFRIRAGYASKYSPYWDTLKYYDNDFLVLPKYKNFLLNLKFLDIFSSPDFLIDKHLKLFFKKWEIPFEDMFRSLKSKK